MGNSQGATIVVQLNQTVFVPGSMLVGKVFVQVTADSVAAKSLHIAIRGYESTAVNYKIGDSKRTAHETRYFLSANVLLAQMPLGKMSKGDYEFPFQFQIPSGLPASVPQYPIEASFYSDRMEITYDVWASLHSGSFSLSGSETMIQGSSQLVIYSGLPAIPTIPKYIDPCFYPVTSFCCLDNGVVAVAMNVSSNIVAPGTPITTYFHVQNNSTQEIECIKFELVQHMSWSAKGVRAGTETCNRSKVLHEVTLDARPTSNTTGLDTPLLLGHKEKITQNDGDLANFKKYLDSGKASVQLTFPPVGALGSHEIPWGFMGTFPSYSGQNCHITHRLVMTVMFGCFAANTELIAEITVVNKLPVALTEEPTIFPDTFNQMGAQLMEQQRKQESMLPQGWRAEAAPMAMISNPVKVTKNGAATADPQNLQPNDMLLHRLKLSFTPGVEVEQYINAYGHSHPNLGLQDSDFTALFKDIPLSYDQIDVAALIGSSLPSISCSTLVRIAAGCLDFNRAEVLTSVLSKTAVADKQNKGQVSDMLTPFQWMNLDARFFA